MLILAHFFIYLKISLKKSLIILFTENSTPRHNPNFFDQNPFPVLEFSFSQCPNNERFLQDIWRCFNNAIEKYNLQLQNIPENLSIESLVGDKFAEALNRLQNQYKKPIVIANEADQTLLNQMFEGDLTETQIANGMNQTTLN